MLLRQLHQLTKVHVYCAACGSLAAILKRVCCTACWMPTLLLADAQASRTDWLPQFRAVQRGLDQSGWAPAQQCLPGMQLHTFSTCAGLPGPSRCAGL